MGLDGFSLRNLEPLREAREKNKQNLELLTKGAGSRFLDEMRVPLGKTRMRWRELWRAILTAWAGRSDERPVSETLMRWWCGPSLSSPGSYHDALLGLTDWA